MRSNAPAVLKWFATLLGLLSIQAHAVVGVDWTLRNPSLTSESFNGIARNGDASHATTILVAVGSHGLIMTSSIDAAHPGVLGTWTARSSGITSNLNAVTWSPGLATGQFVAVGDQGVVLTSPDGITWTQVPASSFAAENFVTVYWTSAKYFIGGNTASGAFVYSSPDAVSWTKYPTLGANTKVRSLSGSLSSTVVAVTDHNIQSASATNPKPVWSAFGFPAPETSVQSMVFLNNTYVISASTAYSAGTIGNSWTKRASLTDASLNLSLNFSQTGTQIVGAGPNGAVWTSALGLAWTALPPAEAGVQLHGAVDLGTDVVAVGDAGRIYRYSSSSSSWTSLFSAGPVTNLTAVGVNGSAVVALGKNFSMLSSDGITWTSSAATIDAYSVLGVGGAGFVAVGTGNIWNSTDGATWTSSNAITGRLNRVVALEDGKAIAVGVDSSTATLSSMIYLFDGTSWNKATLPAGSLKELHGAAASATSTVAVGDGGFVLTSANRTLWTKRAVVLAAGENFTDVVYSGTQFVAATSAGATWTSNDGAVWTKRLAATSPSRALTRLVKTSIGAASQVVGTGAAGTTVRSFGGTYWYGAEMGTGQSMADAVWTGTMLVAVGTNGAIFTSSGPIPPQAAVSFAVDHSSISEGAGTAALTVQLTQTSSLPVTVKYTGSTSAIGFTTLATLGTTGTADYSLPTGGTLTFAPGETSKTITVTIRQDNVDEKDETATITLAPPTGDAILGTPSQHVLTILDDDTKPFISTPADQPQNQIVNVGDALTMTATGGGMAQPTGTWKKNGLVLSGITPTTTLNGSAVPPTTTFKVTYAHAITTNAGAYSIFLSNPSGSLLSDSAQVAVVDNTSKMLVLAENGTATLSVTAAGTGLSYQWQRGNGTPVPLVDDTSAAHHITGAKTAKLTIKRVSMSEADTYFCVVTQTTTTGTPKGTQTKMGGTTDLRVVNQVPVITPPAFGAPNKVVAEAFTTLPVASNLPYKWTVTGLPLGVTFNSATGQLSGRPQKSGSFNLTFTATNAVGASQPVIVPLTIDPLPDGMVGTYMAIGKQNLALDLLVGSRLDLTTTSTGSFSGTFAHGTASAKFTGFLNYSPGSPATATASVAVHPVNFPAVTLTFTLTASSPSVPDTLIVQVTDSAAHSSTFTGWRKTLRTLDVTTVTGLYNFALNLVGSVNGLLDSDDFPEGNGYASFTLKSDGTFTISGQMGDGTPYTSSGFINTGVDPIQVPLYSGLYNNTGAVYGLINLRPDISSAYVKNSLDGNKVVSWTKAKQTGASASYPNGFMDTDGVTQRILSHSIMSGSGRYVPPGPGEIVLEAPPPGLSGSNIGLVFIYGGVSTLDTTVSPPRRDITAECMNQDPNIVASVAAPAVVSIDSTLNPAKTTLTIIPATGFYSGTFTLVNKDPNNNNVTRKGTYSGLVVGHPSPSDRNSMIGYGPFILPHLPWLDSHSVTGYAELYRIR